jgi:hypothetical protein
MAYLASSGLSCILQRLPGCLGYIPVRHSRHHADHIFLRQQAAMLR